VAKRLVLLLLILACKRSPDPAARPPSLAAAVEHRFAPSADALFAHARALTAMNGRGAGTADERAAAEYVTRRLAELGLQPALQEFPHGGATSQNVIAVLPGEDPSRHLLLGAHIDHLGAGYPGADDNASGVAVLLGVAAAWSTSAFRPRHSIVFVGFGAEEVGLVGSTYYMDHPARPIESIAAMINLDMLGRPRFYDYESMGVAKTLAGIADGPGLGLLTGGSTELLAIARCAVKASNLPSYAPEDFPAFRAAIDKATHNRGDFAPFARRGVPFVFFSTSEHDDYHEPTDTIDTIDRAMLRTAAEVVWRTTLALDLLDRRPGDQPVTCP
jgi:Zn-dependent M28 family amino/carboxypeptidase